MLFLTCEIVGFYSAQCAAQSVSSEITVNNGFFNLVWQTEDGLPDNDVHGVVLGGDGFLWVGTRHGLVRFDGTHFIPAVSKGGLNIERASIWRMCSSRDGNVVAAIESGGVALGNHDYFSWARAADEPDSQKAFQLCGDQLGRIWSVSLGGKVERISEGVVKSLGIRGNGAFGPPTVAVDRDNIAWVSSKGTIGYFEADEFVQVADGLPAPLFIAPARAGGIWMVTADSICRVEKDQPVLMISHLPWSPQETNIRDMLEDEKGGLWLGTSRKGLIRFSGGLFQSVVTSHNNILCLAEDRVGDLWVGTQGGGLNRIRSRQFKILDTHRGLPNDSVFSFAEDIAGRIWMATQDGGLCTLSNGVVTPFSEAKNWPPLCLAPDPLGGIWIGTQKNGLVHCVDNHFVFATRDTGLQIELLNCLLADQTGRVWAGSMLEGLFSLKAGRLEVFTTKNGLPDNGVRSLVEDRHGAIWAGTDGGGIARYENGVFQKFTHDHWPGDAVRALLATEDDSIWIGTTGRGLIRFKAGFFKEVNQSNGLPDEAIQELMLDEAGWVWCGGAKGLFRVKLADLNAAADGRLQCLQTMSYGRSDGLPDYQFNGEFQPAAFHTHSGRFFFASSKGAVTFQPEALPQNREQPNIYIEKVSRNDLPLPPSAGMLLGAGVHTLAFKFVAPDFEAPERVRYKYKLDGLGADWSLIGRDTTALFTNIPPGSYRFRVIACNCDGIWNERGVELAFSVKPFFWQTWWFTPVVLVGCLALLITAIRWATLRWLRRRIAILESKHALEKERTRIAQDIHDELGANLTSIGWLADLGRKHQSQPEAVGQDLEKIALTARESLSAMDAIVWALNPHNDSSENFANYVAHFANEFFAPTKIRCRLDIPPDLSVRPMSTDSRHHLFLALKEALHNVLQHSSATVVWLRMGETPSQLRISIEDDGKGLPQSSTHPGHSGLANIRRRIESLGGEIFVESGPATGTALHFLIPWQRMAAK